MTVPQVRLVLKGTRSNAGSRIEMNLGNYPHETRLPKQQALLIAPTSSDEPTLHGSRLAKLRQTLKGPRNGKTKTKRTGDSSKDQGSGCHSRPHCHCLAAFPGPSCWCSGISAARPAKVPTLSLLSSRP